MKRYLIVLLATIFSCFLAAQTPYDSLYLKSPIYKTQMAFYQNSLLTHADIVMLGNSITYGGRWNDLLGRTSIANRGIGGDNTLGMLHRLEYVRNLTPKVCFVMAGINDLYADASVDLIVRHYESILDTLLRADITPVIQSTLFVNPRWKRAEEKNAEVKELNARLKGIASAKGLRFIDVNSILAPDGILLDRFTTDGVHLTPDAYVQWRTLLLPTLKEIGL